MTVDAIGGLTARAALAGLPAPMGTVGADAHLTGAPLTGIAPLAPILLTPTAGTAVDFTAIAAFAACQSSRLAPISPLRRSRLPAAFGEDATHSNGAATSPSAPPTRR